MSSDAAIVIVTNEYDAHADFMVEHLQRVGHPVIRFHPDELGLYYQSELNIDASTRTSSFRDTITGSEFDLYDAKSVWWRRPKRIRVDPEIVGNELRYVRRESFEFIDGLWSSMQTFWLDHPFTVLHARYKIEQLQRAARLGFRIPQTLVTNNVQAAKTFYHEHPEGVIYKSLNNPAMATNTHVMANPDDEGYDLELRTTLLTDQHLDLLEGIVSLPSLFQTYIPKKYELRVTVVGHQVFAAEIHSQEREETKIDWRDYTVNIPYRRATLPKSVERLCLEFVQSYGLHYSALDLIVTPDDEYVFIENNPAGQFLFVEEAIPELKMFGAVVDLLVQPPVRVA